MSIAYCARRSGPLHTTVSARSAWSGLMTADGVAWAVLFPLLCVLGAGNVTGVVGGDGGERRKVVVSCPLGSRKPGAANTAAPRHAAALNLLNCVLYCPWRRRPCRSHTSQSALEAALCVHPSLGPARRGPNARAHACRCTATNRT